MYWKPLVAVLVSGIIVGAPRLAHAQEPARPDRVSAGGFWSANFASVSLSPTVHDITARQSIGGGLTIEFPFGQIWSLDARAFWNRRGARLPVPETTGHRDLSVDYLSMPVLLKTSGTGSVRPYAVGGAEVSVRVRARIRAVVGTSDTLEDGDPPIGRTDVALTGGAGVERSLDHARVFVEAIYAHGLRDISSSPSGNLPGNLSGTLSGRSEDSAHTRTLTLLAGIRF